LSKATPEATFGLAFIHLDPGCQESYARYCECQWTANWASDEGPDTWLASLAGRFADLLELSLPMFLLDFSYSHAICGLTALGILL
jgi:hypothetical protein